MRQSLIAALAALSFVAVSAADWPRHRGPTHDGISTETNWVHQWTGNRPREAWRASVNTGFAAVAVAGGRAFTVGNTNETDTVHALDADTGKPLWTFSHPEPSNPKMYEGGPNSTPTVDGDRLFVASRSGRLFSLESATGKVQWSNDLAAVVGEKNGDWGLAGSPLRSGDAVYVNYGSAMVALEAATGRTLWQSAKEPKGKYSFTSPVLSAVVGTPVLLAHMHKALFGLDPVDGRVRWRHEFGRGYETHCSDPVLVAGGVFISSGDDGGELVSLGSDAGSRVWKNGDLGTFTGTAVALNGYLSGVDSGGYKKGQQELRCLNARDGRQLWSLSGYSQDSWIAAGDRLLVLTELGELVVVRIGPERGEILARAQVLSGKCWTEPSLANGRLYCRNARGQIVCLDLR